MKIDMKKIGQLICSLAVLTSLLPMEAEAARMINHWGFDTLNGKPLAKDATEIDDDDVMDNTHNTGNQWKLTVKSHGIVDQSAHSSIRGNELLPTNPAYYPHEYLPDSLLDKDILDTYGSYGAHAHLGGTTGKGGNYLYAQGDELDFSKSWSYSIVSWVNPEVTAGKLSLFSIGDSNRGFSFGYNGVNQSLQFYMYEANGAGGFNYENYSEFRLDHAFTGGSSNWHHVGFSISNDGQGNLSVNYYVEGKIVHTETKSNSLLADQKLNGFNVGSSGVSGTNIGSCNYDDIKIFEGVLTDEEATESIRPGGVPSPAVPEPTTASLALLGLAGMALRRRR